MWSKRSIAKPLVDFMLSKNPNCKYVYDLFWWGGAISFEFQRRGIQAHYNELNTWVCELLKKIRDEWITQEFYQWIDRDTFNKHKEDPTRFGWRLATCWSFGNNQKNYLYGKDIEELKKQAHEYIMNKWYDPKTRWKLLKEFKEQEKITGRLNLKRLQHLEHLKRLKRLQHLQHLQHLDNFPTITNLSYDQIEITTPPEETIIYLDPPYKNTAEYKEKVDHDKLYERIKKQRCKVYVSSYEYELPLVFGVEKSVLLSSDNTKKRMENLYLFDPTNE